MRVPRVPPHLRLPLAAGLVASAVAAALLLGALATPAPGEQESEVEEAGGGTGWAALVVAVATSFVGWARTGAPLLRRAPSLARERVGIHGWISIAALSLAAFHGTLLMRIGDFRGLLSGWLSTGLMLALFVTGWWRDALVARWGRRAWRIVHWELACGSIALGVEHWLLIEASRGA